MQTYPPPSSLNLEYLLLRGQDFIGALGVDGWPHGLLLFIEDVMIFGMVLSLLLIIFAVYSLIRLQQVEHEGFHTLEVHAHEPHGEAETVSHSNDRWSGIVALANSTSESDWRRAILEADIMLFDVLRVAGYPGDTVGEQLKMANPIQMTTLDLAWKAHKMRNDVAHQGEQLQLTERDVKTTVDYYKRVFEEFDAI